MDLEATESIKKQIDAITKAKWKEGSKLSKKMILYLNVFEKYFFRFEKIEREWEICYLSCKNDHEWF